MANDNTNILLEKIEQVLDANIMGAPGPTYNHGKQVTGTDHTSPDPGSISINTYAPLVSLGKEDQYPTIAVKAHRDLDKGAKHVRKTAILTLHSAHRPEDTKVDGRILDEQLHEIAKRAGLQEHGAKGRPWEVPPGHYCVVDDGDHHHYIPGRPDGDNLTMDPIPNHRRSLHIRAEDQGKLLDAVRQLRADHDQPPKGYHVESAVDQAVVKQQEHNRS